MYGDNGIVITRFGVFHPDISRVRNHSVTVLSRIIDGEVVCINFGFVEHKEGELSGIGGPPESIVTRENFFFVDPVGDTVEERSIS